MKKLKRIFSTIIFTVAATSSFAQITEELKSFVKGSIQEKTFIVKQADSQNAEILSKAAIDFALENKNILENDRELSALVVAGVLSMPQAYIDSLNYENQAFISDKFLSVYESFEDPTVKTAILTKLETSKLPGEKFTNLLNEYVQNAEPNSESYSILTASIKTLKTYGNAQTFEILFNKINDSNWNQYQSELKNSLAVLSEKNPDKLLSMIQKSSTEECRFILDLMTKNQEISKSFVADIAENVLSRTIYIVEETDSVTEELIALQLDSYTILADLNWPRAAATCLVYFSIAKQEYEQTALHEDNFADVIKALPIVAPMDCVTPLSDYLSSINKSMEKNGSLPSEKVVLAIISSLGAIGDKNAFDSLLGVTYYNYSDTVIAQARSALAKLKW